ncbi:MAG: ATP-binding protein [Candidatus Margulisiibacteriota bacterium]|nr:ATP-binding protein [Candidatus Margulisiibacteriota bacterium]
MMSEQPVVGYVPAPIIELHSGVLFNVAIGLLVFLCSIFAAWVILTRCDKTSGKNLFVLFLASLGLYWLLISVGNIYQFLNLLEYIPWIAYLIKGISILPFVLLAYYLCTQLFENEFLVGAGTFIYFLVCSAYVYMTITVDGTANTATYWGVQWQVSGMALELFRNGLILPLVIAAGFLLLENLYSLVIERIPVNISLYLASLVFIFVEFIQTGAKEVSWEGVLSRLAYVFIVLLVYIYYVEMQKGSKFVDREENVVYRRMPRIPYFVKLLLIFIVISLIPITISSLLIFVSFKEIIDLYIYKPLLWNLKVSREAFLAALSSIQIQAIFLMLLTGTIVLVVSVIVSRSISRSLGTISKGMDKLSRGDYSFKIRRDSNDEVGDLINYFNDMSAQIKRSRELVEAWNKELEKKVAERTEDLRALFNISKSIGSSLDIELLFSKTMEQLLPILKVNVYAMLMAGEKGSFTVRFSQGVKELPEKVEVQTGILGEACSKNEIIFSENVLDDPRCKGDFYKKLGLRSIIIVPLRAKGNTRGILCLGTKEYHKFSKERDVNLLSTISDQLAIALENAGIYEKEKAAVERLTQLDVMKNEFISMVSHELRTPITAVDGYISLFLNGTLGALTEDQKKYLSMVKDNGQRLLNIINRLLDFSLIEASRFKIAKELVSMDDILYTVEAVVKPIIIKYKAEFKMNLKAKNDKFMGDRNKMIEVLVNLIENALKFTVENEAPKIEASTKNTGDYLRVEVADKGIGIEKEYFEKVFNKYYQVEDTMTRKAGGVGLGLAIVKEVIAGHKGKIWIESGGKGKGSKFIFEVPVAEKI